MSRKFILQEPLLDDVKIIETKLQNDMYTKYKIEAKVQGEMICSTDDKSFQKEEKKVLRKETYQDYLDFIDTIPVKNYKWIYNIVDGIAEQDDIVYSDDHFILIPTDTWDKKDMSKIHILSIVKNKNLRSIRSLTGEHVKLLEHIVNKSLEQIESIYKIPKDQFRVYIHYYPSTWHLHIHFNLVENREHACIINEAYDLRQIIFNLKMCSDYYQKIDMYVMQ
jgi:m7GpppX diphosphatase